MNSTNSAKAAILEAIRQTTLAPVDLPAHDGPWITFPDPVAHFVEVVQSVGGEVRFCADRMGLDEQLQQWEPYRQSRMQCSVVEGVGHNDQAWESCPDPHQFQTIDLAIVPGEFGVAENGAVWVDDRVLPQRVLPFITQHLVLVVPRPQVCHNMHEGYARLTLGARPFGVFISGPSKTADIEQSLVIGAHGARTLLVVLVG